MKVLHLPSNLASQLDVSVRALREIGVEARGLVCGNYPWCDSGAIEVYTVPSLRKHPITGAIRAVAWLSRVLKAARWAEVIHWHSDWSPIPGDLDLRYVARLGKPRIVEFWGSDIRTSEVACAENPYLTRAFAENPRLFRSGRRSGRRTQERFARHGFACLIPGADLRHHVCRDVFPTPYYTMQRLLLDGLEPRYPDPRNDRPLVIHSPSHEFLKGTHAVLRAVRELSAVHSFDFQLLQWVGHAEAMALVRRCDVYLDQFLAGTHGVASLEAMALGKPTVCYLKPSVESGLPSGCPLVNANQDNLAGVLADLLTDGRRRHELGRQGRAYVEKHHDARVIARQLVGIYEELLAKRQVEPSGAGR